MRLMFYAPQHTGHHFAYLARMLPGFIGLPVEITVATTPQALQSNEYARTLAPLARSIRLVTCCTPPPRKPLRNARHRFAELVQAIHMINPGHVAVCYADGVWDQAYLSTIAGRRPWPRELPIEGWIYRGRFGDLQDRRWKSILRRRMFRGLLRRGVFHKLHLHHELLYEFAANVAASTPTSVVLAPDPIVIKPPMTVEAARRELGLPPDGTWIGTVGVIARFKGSDLFLEAFRLRCEHDVQPSVRALLAGPHEDEIRTMLQREPYRTWVAEGRIVSLDRFLNEDEMYAAASAVNVVVSPYPQHQNRSSIILWAAAAGRPSVASDESNVGYVMRKERLGTACKVYDPTLINDAVTATLSTPWTEEDAQRVRRYAEFHRIENYQRISSQLVRERLIQQATIA
ncbi:MAG: glycosyltransferase [Planctomycetes bacterium]|nr:glycosyltransferase [Planctomycetota bacterium]